MTDDSLHRALREGLEGALTELQAQRRDQHKLELHVTAEVTELRATQKAIISEQLLHSRALHGNGDSLQTLYARLDERITQLEKAKHESGQVRAAKITAGASTRNQWIMLIGTLLAALTSLGLGIVQLMSSGG